MPTIADVRQQYPQYHDMSDQQLADALHAKFYSDMPKAAFYQKVGLSGGSDPVTRKSVSVDEMRQFAGAPRNALAAFADVVGKQTSGGSGLGGIVGGAMDAVIGRGVDAAMNAGATLGGNRNARGPVARGVGGQAARGVLESGQSTLASVAKMVPAGNALAMASQKVLDRTVPAETPRNALERTARIAGQMAPNALLPGSALARAKNVILPTVGAAVAGETARAMGADEQGAAIAQTVGGVAGGVLANVRPTPRRPINETALAKYAKRTGANLDELRARAEEYRTAGIEPTLTDITDESGRGVIRAAASRMTPGRQVAQDFGDRRALDLPSRIARQAAGAAPERVSTLADPQVQVGDLGARIGGDLPAGPAVSSALNRSFDAANGRVNAAYQSARASAADQAHVPISERPTIASNLREALADYDPAAVPRVTGILQKVDELGTITARDLFEARTRLGNLRVSADPVEAGAAGRAVRALDAEIERVAPNMTGDPTAVATWRAAIGERRQFGRQFEGGDLINSLTEREHRGGAMTNAVAPEDAANHIFGRSPLGFVGKPNFARDISRLRDTLGADSAEWRALSGEVYNRLIKASTGQNGVDGVRLNQNLDRLGDTAGIFFSQQQRARVRALAANLQTPNPGEVGRAITAPSTDAFVADVGRLPAEARPAAQAAGVRQIQQQAGNSLSGAPGLARRLADAPEQQTRNATLFGPAAADRLQQGMRLEERAVRNARDIAPRTGSQTQLRAQDAIQAAGEGARMAGKFGRADFIGGTLDAANMWLKSRGFSDAQAEELVRLATDPRRTDAVLQTLERAVGRSETIEWAKGIGPRLLEAGRSPQAATSAAVITATNSQPSRRPTRGQQATSRR